MFWDNWERADRIRASKKEVCVSVFLCLPGMLCVLVWGAIFSLDAPLLKYGITDPASTSPSFCTNFSCPSVTTPAGKVSGAWNTLLALSNKVAGKQD